jgi:ABC-type nitrate/sulfonate/bicarbonate transport system permease component
MSDAPISILQSQAEERQSINHTHRWIFLTVAITAAVALTMVTLPLVSSIVLKTVSPSITIFFWLIFLELLLVGYLAAALPGSSTSSAGSIFLAITVLNGLIFPFVLAYAGGSIGETYLFTLYDSLAGAGWLWRHISATLSVVLYGFVFALVVGLPLGILLGSTRHWRQVWHLAVQSTYGVSKTMLYPIFIVLFGIGIVSRIAIAFSHAVVPLMIGAMTGLGTAKATQMDVSGAPALITAVRTGLSLAVIGVVLSEMYVSTEGLGFLLMVSATARGEANRMLAVILLLFIVLLLVNVGLWALAKRLRARRSLSTP